MESFRKGNSYVSEPCLLCANIVSDVHFNGELNTHHSVLQLLTRCWQQDQRRQGRHASRGRLRPWSTLQASKSLQRTMASLHPP